VPITSAQLHDPILPYVQPPALVLAPDDTIEVALEKARQLPATQIVLYCYVVDNEQRLVGIVPIRRLLTSAADAHIKAVMISDVVAIPYWATVLVAAEYFTNRRFLAFPVVDNSGRLEGVVDVSLFTDDVLTLARQSFEGIFQIIGVHATASRTPWTGFKDRFPWLLCNVAGGLMCAFVSSRYEHLLSVIVVLALFIPLVLALAESVSIQSVTLTLQNLQDGPIHWASVSRAVTKELLTALLLGAGCGTLVGTATLIWQRNFLVPAVLAAAIAASMVTACLFGVLMPMGLRALKADPRIAAGPIVLALTDMAALLFYFNLAGLLLG
jgi:magnesium transporter